MAAERAVGTVWMTSHVMAVAVAAVAAVAAAAGPYPWI